MDVSFGDDNSKVFDGVLVEEAFLWLEVKIVLCKAT
jgi:hypothetical protein